MRSALADPRWQAVEFIMQSGRPRRYRFPVLVARFLGEYLTEYRQLFDRRP